VKQLVGDARKHNLINAARANVKGTSVRIVNASERSVVPTDNAAPIIVSKESAKVQPIV
jgi:hypothetical protein